MIRFVMDPVFAKNYIFALIESPLRLEISNGISLAKGYADQIVLELSGTIQTHSSQLVALRRVLEDGQIARFPESGSVTYPLYEEVVRLKGRIDTVHGSLNGLIGSIFMLLLQGGYITKRDGDRYEAAIPYVTLDTVSAMVRPGGMALKLLGEVGITDQQNLEVWKILPSRVDQLWQGAEKSIQTLLGRVERVEKRKLKDDPDFAQLSTNTDRSIEALQDDVASRVKYEDYRGYTAETTALLETLKRALEKTMGELAAETANRSAGASDLNERLSKIAQEVAQFVSLRTVITEINTRLMTASQSAGATVDPSWVAGVSGQLEGIKKMIDDLVSQVSGLSQQAPFIKQTIEQHAEILNTHTRNLEEFVPSFRSRLDALEYFQQQQPAMDNRLSEDIRKLDENLAKQISDLEQFMVNSGEIESRLDNAIEGVKEDIKKLQDKVFEVEKRPAAVVQPMVPDAPTRVEHKQLEQSVSAVNAAMDALRTDHRNLASEVSVMVKTADLNDALERMRKHQGEDVAQIKADTNQTNAELRKKILDTDTALRRLIAETVAPVAGSISEIKKALGTLRMKKEITSVDLDQLRQDLMGVMTTTKTESAKSLEIYVKRLGELEERMRDEGTCAIAVTEFEKVRSELTARLEQLSAELESKSAHDADIRAVRQRDDEFADALKKMQAEHEKAIQDMRAEMELKVESAIAAFRAKTLKDELQVFVDAYMRDRAFADVSAVTKLERSVMTKTEFEQEIAQRLVSQKNLEDAVDPLTARVGKLEAKDCASTKYVADALGNYVQTQVYEARVRTYDSRLDKLDADARTRDSRLATLESRPVSTGAVTEGRAISGAGVSHAELNAAIDDLDKRISAKSYVTLSDVHSIVAGVKHITVQQLESAVAPLATKAELDSKADAQKVADEISKVREDLKATVFEATKQLADAEELQKYVTKEEIEQFARKRDLDNKADQSYVDAQMRSTTSLMVNRAVLSDYVLKTELSGLLPKVPTATGGAQPIGDYATKMDLLQKADKKYVDDRFTQVTSDITQAVADGIVNLASKEDLQRDRETLSTGLRAARQEMASKRDLEGYVTKAEMQRTVPRGVQQMPAGDYATRQDVRAVQDLATQAAEAAREATARVATAATKEELAAATAGMQVPGVKYATEAQLTFVSHQVDGLNVRVRDIEDRLGPAAPQPQPQVPVRPQPRVQPQVPARPQPSAQQQQQHVEQKEETAATGIPHGIVAPGSLKAEMLSDSCLKPKSERPEGCNPSHTGPCTTGTQADRGMCNFMTVDVPDEDEIGDSDPKRFAVYRGIHDVGTLIKLQLHKARTFAASDSAKAYRHLWNARILASEYSGAVGSGIPSEGSRFLNHYDMEIIGAMSKPGSRPNIKKYAADHNSFDRAKYYAQVLQKSPETVRDVTAFFDKMRKS